MLIDFLFWCSVINLGVMLYWFLAIALAKDLIYKMHYRFFAITKEDFFRIHYMGITFFKLTVFFFSIIPYLVIRYLL